MPTLIPAKFQKRSPERIGFIMGLYALRNPTAPSTKEKKRAIAIIGTKIDDSDVTDEHVKGFTSRLESSDEDATRVSLADGVTVLNRSERERLTREVDAARWETGRKQNNWLIPV